MDIFLLCREAAILFKQEGGWVVPVEGQGNSLTERTAKEVGNIAFASLQKSVLKVEKVGLDDGCSSLDLLKEPGIHCSEVAITLVNGHHVPLAQALPDAKVVAIFPPIAGG